MLIYSKSRKDESFDQLLTYLNKEEEKERIAILHNFRSQGDDIKEIEGEFDNNYQYCQKRSNGVVLFHEVMSFSEEDRDFITEEILEDMGRRYIEKRAYNALVYAKVHLDRSNPHIHFIISGNLLESSKKLRLSKARFHNIKRELEQYQLEKYPFLDKSIATREEREKRGLAVKGKRKGRKEQEQVRRQGREEQILLQFLECINALTYDEYLDRLSAAGLQEYWRGKTPGIIDLSINKKHRLKTLGVLEEYKRSLARWKMQMERLKDLRSDRGRKIIRHLLDLGYREQVSEVLRPDPGERIKELRAIRRRKKQEKGRDI